jgi:predicted AlkP superfamily phosphohydrolase/phosphomutase
MKAFALPTYFQGMIRLNVQGREAGGIVAAKDFRAVCDDLSVSLSRLACARSGRPIVDKVIPIRTDPFDDRPHSNPADLFVLWRDDVATDVVGNPEIGRIGPIPYFRTGGHASAGFACLKGPGIPAGSRLPDHAQVVDLTATVLALMGETIPLYMEGKPFWPAIRTSGRSQ